MDERRCYRGLNPLKIPKKCYKKNYLTYRLTNLIVITNFSIYICIHNGK